MDLASLLFPPSVHDAVPVRHSLCGRIGASMLARASRRQAESPTARCAEALVGAPAPLLAPREGAFHAQLAALAREWLAP